jgi:flagellar hook-basal body complex protein FliE
MIAIAATGAAALQLRPADPPLRWGGEQTIGINDLERPTPVGQPKEPEAPGKTGFGEILAATVDQAAALGQAAEARADAFARGALDDLHGTMIAAKEAEISLKLVGSVRNKLLDAFHELWRTAV